MADAGHFDAFAVRWSERVLRPGPLSPAERQDVERAVRRCYLAARRVPPSLIAWFAEPDAAARLSRNRTALVEHLVSARPWFRRFDRAAQVARAPWCALGGGIAGAGTGLLLIFGLLMARAMAGWFGLIAILLTIYFVVTTRLRVRERSLRTQRLAGYALIGLMILAVMALGVAPEALTSDVSSAGWATGVMAVVVPSAALVGAVLGWRRGRRPYPARLERQVMDVGQVLTADVRRRIRRATRRSASWGAAWYPTPLGVPEGWSARAVEPRLVAEWAWRRQHRDRERARDAWVLEAHETVARVAWSAHRRIVVAVEPPVVVHAGPFGIHRWDGPAVEWADGSVWYALRGVRLPRCPAEGDWTVDEIHAVRNSEVRRIMIESIGWDEYLERAGAERVAAAPDPGNPPHELALYEAPAVFGDGVRMLVMTNASPDRSGAVRRYAETVPATFDDPVAAAAWQYGVPVEIYRELARRT